MESPKIHPHIFDWMIFNKGIKTTHGERIVSSTNGVRKTGYSYTKEWIWTLTLHHIQKLTQNGNLKVRPETIKLIEENIRENPHDIVTSKDSLDMTPKKDNKSKNRQIELHET